MLCTGFLLMSFSGSRLKDIILKSMKINMKTLYCDGFAPNICSVPDRAHKGY